MGFAYPFTNRTPTQFDIVMPTSLLRDRHRNAYPVDIVTPTSLLIDRYRNAYPIVYCVSEPGECLTHADRGFPVLAPYFRIGAARDMAKFPTSLAGSVGTTPHLVGVAHLRILISQSIAEIRPLFDFGKYFSGYPFHVFHRSLDLNLSLKKPSEQFFWSYLIF